MLPRQGHRLLQLGIVLLLATSFEGFVIPALASPALGRSTHTLAALSAVLLIGLGLMWPRLVLGPGASRWAFWLLVYSDLAIMTAFLLGAVWGAGSTVMPLAAGPAHGSDSQEAIIRVIAWSSGPTGIAAFMLILWGLRRHP